MKHSTDDNYIGGDGILTGCDQNQEWMLKWWWENYTACNQFPVTFVDFGMTASAKKWCEKHGTVTSFALPDNFFPNKDRYLTGRSNMFLLIKHGKMED